MGSHRAGDGKVALVTGTASGMGAVLAKDMIDQGYFVACLDINEEVGNKLATELGERAFFIRCNVADYNDQAKAYQAVFDKWKRIDCCLFNAGIVDRSSIYILDRRNNKEIPPAPNVLTTQVDYLGVVYGTQLAIHFMRQNPSPGGQIVATASIAAIHPHECFPEYCGAKAAVMQFCRTVAPIVQLKDNITINVVLPGIVRTPIIPQAMVDAVSAECLTPVSTIVAAYNLFLNDKSRNGQVIECSANEHFLVPDPPLLNGYKTQRACTVYDPLFKLMHGEGCGLPEAVGVEPSS